MNRLAAMSNHCQESLLDQIKEKRTMALYIATFTWNQAPNEEFMSLLPQEQEKVQEMMAQGKLRWLFLAADNSGGWAIHSASSPDEVLKRVEHLPLLKFMNIELQELQDVYSAVEAVNS